MQMYNKVYGRKTPLDAIDLFTKHVDEYREKTQNLKDIRKVVLANLAHIE